MNNAGLESSIYEQLRGYSEALNHYLVKLKTESPAPQFMPPREVADLIRGLGEMVPDEVSVQLLSSGLRERGAFPPTVVKRLRSALDSGVPARETVNDLEQLAHYLGRHQAGAFARLRRMR
jgi:hypothetical protein